MAFRICFVATRQPLEQVCAALSLDLGPEVAEVPFDDEFWAANIEDNVCLIWSQDELFVDRHSNILRALSETGPVYGCHVNETVMAANLTCFQAGDAEWSVHWIGDKGPVPENLTTKGPVPKAYNHLVDRAHKQILEEPGIDWYFEVPPDLGSSLFGFRHDDFLKEGEFFRISKKKPLLANGFFTRWFSK